MEIKDILLKTIGKMDIEKIIEEEARKAIDKCLKDTVQNMFRSYSDFGKALDKKLTEVFSIDLKKMDFGSYNMLIQKIIKEKIESKIDSEAVDKLNNYIETLFTGLEKDTYKLSELINKMKERYAEYKDMDDLPDCCSVYVDSPDTDYSRTISFDTEENKSEYECRYVFHVHNESNRLFGLRIKGLNIEKGILLCDLNVFERLLVRLQANEGKVIIDDYDDSYDEIRERNGYY
jgi:hypothetical protein